MAKQIPPTSQAEISVLAFSIKGDGTVVQAALQTLAKQGVSFQPIVTTMATPKPPTVALPATSDGAVPAEQQLSLDEIVAPEPAVTKPAKKRNGHAPPKIVDALRAHDAPMSFKEFVGTRTVAKHVERVVVVAMWLRDHRQVEKFGVNELFTCCRMVDWTLPNDPGQPLRDAAKAQYVRSEGDGAYSITTAGMKKYTEVV